MTPTGYWLKRQLWRQSPKGNLCHVSDFWEVGFVLTLAEGGCFGNKKLWGAIEEELT